MLQKLHRNRSNNWPMVSFIHNGNGITTWIGYSFKTKSTKSKKRSNIFKIASFLKLKLQIIRLAQGQWSCTPTLLNSYFYSYTFEKTYLAVHFTKGCFCQFVDRKFVGLMPKYYLLVGDTSQVSIFSLTQDKNE